MSKDPDRKRFYDALYHAIEHPRPLPKRLKTAVIIGFLIGLLIIGVSVLGWPEMNDMPRF
ncbi:MAG TPA: hypothetical protein VFO52_03225 [Longimicrobiales bacterium]|nr:hypothetical protein [Longimicrobiales bacterium]